MRTKIGITLLFIFVLKSLFLYTHHIQEDAFITWRVAQNLLDYGVIGFNGDIKISASTTHLYTFVSYLFNLIFGKDNFIYPILLFNSFLFTIGTYWFTKVFLNDTTKIILALFFLNFLPPSIKISILGMEYGLMFFFYAGLLLFGLVQRQKWAYILFPILLIWCRLDAAIFLGLFFFFDLLKYKRWNFSLMWSGLIGLGSVLLFNHYYFGDWVNNTIIAKSIAYPYSFKVKVIMQYFPNYLGVVKVPENIVSVNYLTFIILIAELFALLYLLLKSMSPHKDILLFVFVFAWVKQLLFIGRLSLFDWYYWTPQIFLFALIIIAFLNSPHYKRIAYNFAIFIMLPMVLYQTVHSIASGNGEWNYRRQIGNYLNEYEKDKEQWIFLEPAGYIPYFSQLKTIDFVGLVDKGVQENLKKDNQYFIQPTLQERQPKYYLSLGAKEEFKNASDSLYFKDNYLLIKHFEIEKHLQSDNELLQKIYQLKPSGRDYWLYRRYDSF